MIRAADRCKRDQGADFARRFIFRHSHGGIVAIALFAYPSGLPDTVVAMIEALVGGGE